MLYMVKQCKTWEIELTQNLQKMKKISQNGHRNYVTEYVGMSILGLS